MSAAGSGDPVAASRRTLFSPAKSLCSCWVPILRLDRQPNFPMLSLRMKKRPALKYYERPLSLNHSVWLSKLGERSCVHLRETGRRISVKDVVANIHLGSFPAPHLVLEDRSQDAKWQKSGEALECIDWFLTRVGFWYFRLVTPACAAPCGLWRTSRTGGLLLWPWLKARHLGRKRLRIPLGPAVSCDSTLNAEICPIKIRVIVDFWDSGVFSSTWEMFVDLKRQSYKLFITL